MTTFDLIVSYPVPVKERKEFDYLLSAYAQTPQGSWLNDMAWRGFEFKYCQKMAESSVMGAFVVTKPQTIFLMPESATILHDAIFNAKHRSAWPEIIVPTLIHELRHAWQYRRRKWLYVLCCLPVIREFTIESDAKRITREADKFFEIFNARRTAREFEERMT